ncbi:MAG: hypothetical protein J3K34DRAFT_438042 [Monoraphidium minutum]|nr:MAG: hypothetical protein J3K34DRAFT_438042 [Monoraphidium minutum]
MTFTFGTFVAYIITGNLRVSYALAYGLINLMVAPLGMSLFRRAALPSHVLLLFSAAMGLAAMGALAAMQLAPWARQFAGVAAGREAPRDGNMFALARFCEGHHYHPRYEM